MTIRITVRSEGENLKTFTYSGVPSLLIPEIGEEVVHPRMAKTLRVQSRTIEYGTDSLRVTLNCA